MKSKSLPSVVLAIVLLFVAACDPGSDAPATGDAAADSAVVDTTAAATTDGLLNPNDASAEELRGLGLDSAVVATVVEERPFDTMVPLNATLAEHMDSTALDQLYREMFIPLDLNTATREEILLVPGVGDRMAHEFEEYRPYRGIEQFRREIGKYVDEQEVARLEQYVTIR